jgi:thiamine biosynthesis lipoprotein
MQAELTFSSMGSKARLVLEGAPDGAAEDCRAFLERFEATLSRFRPDSELCRLNAHPSATVPVSPLLRVAVAAGLWAAARTHGLVDPTLVGELEAAGYAASRLAPELSLAEALACAPQRRPARPDPAARWRAVAIDRARSVVTRPPGVRLDTGGIGKGLAADLLADRLAGLARWAVDCGGDLRVRAPADAPFAVDVAHPLTGEVAHRLWLTGGAVATSGLDVRLWRRADGRPAHHLLDPATGEPAWTGLVGATALAPTGLEAEALAKAALLSGPTGAHRWLRDHGGLTVREGGEVELHGPLRARPVVRVTVRREAA